MIRLASQPTMPPTISQTMIPTVPSCLCGYVRCGYVIRENVDTAYGTREGKVKRHGFYRYQRGGFGAVSSAAVFDAGSAAASPSLLIRCHLPQRSETPWPAVRPAPWSPA